MARRWFVHVLGAGSLATLVAVFFGCMSLSIGGRTVLAPEGDLLEQQGKIDKFPPGDGLEVFYPVPYASPPNLELSAEANRSDLEFVELLEQREDRFRIRTRKCLSGAICWKARGVRRAVVINAKTPEAPGLPDRPVPTEQPDR